MLKKWEITEIKTDNDSITSGIAPLILSVSRRTDIPAFYGKWFANRWKAGYCAVKNPYNQKIQYISFKNARWIVFWTKNPRPIFPFLDILDRQGIQYYFLFTLNDYEKEKYEPFLLPLQERIDTFRRLSEKIGPERIVWRFDPVIITSDLPMEEMLQRVEHLGNKLKGFTQKMIFSFVEINHYPKVQNQMKNIDWQIITPEEKIFFAQNLAAFNQQWELSEIALCATDDDFSQYGITHSRCIDPLYIFRHSRTDDRIFQLFNDNKIDLSDNNLKRLKDKGQRKACGCMISCDIGAYNTCPHGCIYCYACQNRSSAVEKFSRHNPDDEFL